MRPPERRIGQIEFARLGLQPDEGRGGVIIPHHHYHAVAVPQLDAQAERLRILGRGGSLPIAHRAGRRATRAAEIPLAGHSWPSHPAGMFVVTDAEAAAIRAAFERGGEFAAAVELRRLFPGVTDNAEARECARTIAAWKPLPLRKMGRSESVGRGRMAPPPR